MNEKTMTLTRMEAPAQLPVRKRVAAYARVSMEKDAIKTYSPSLLAQRKRSRYAMYYAHSITA